MRKTFFTTLFALLFCLNGQGQSCLPNGINFYSQAEIDNFAINYPGCKVIEGNVYIYSGNISNLNGLSVLTAVNGYFAISWLPALTSLNGMQNITSIKDLSIYNTGLTSLNGLQGLTSLETLSLGGDPGNPSLTSLSGMPNVTSMKGIYIQNAPLTSLNGLQNITSLERLDIYGSPLTSLNGIQNITSMKSLSIGATALTSLNGLQNLTEVGTLAIDYNPSLTSLSGVENIASMQNLSIRNNPLLASLNGIQNIVSLHSLSLSSPVLTSLNGLQNLTSLDSLVLGYNTAMTSLSGLPNITSLQDLSMSYNDAITSLSGLENIASIDNLWIQSNGALTSLSGLENITSLESLLIAYNPMLTSLSGLGNITSINTLAFNSNEALLSLNDLQNLTSLKSLEINYSAFTDLDGLQNLDSLGSLGLYGNPVLTSLNGLQNIAAVQNLSLWYNPALTNLNGLQSVTAVQNLSLRDNVALANLNGLQNIASLGSLSIENSGLTSLSGLENITSLNGSVQIYSNPQLANLSGMDNVDSIGGGFWIQSNPALSNLNALGSLHRIGYHLSIYDNDALANLDGLENLATIGGNPQYPGDTLDGSLDIYSNQSLSNLNGLKNLVSVKKMIVAFNPSLSECAISAVCNLLFNAPNLVNIGNNAPDCNSAAEVEALCGSIPVVAEVRIDNNGNCQPDASDPFAEGVQVRLSGTTQMALRATDADGQVRFGYLESGAFSLHLPEYPTAHWAACQPAVVLNPNGSTDTLRATLLLSPLTQCPELTVDLGLPTNFRSCFINSNVRAAARNTGTVLAEGVKVAVVMPPVFEWLSAVPLVSFQNGDTLFFEMGDLKPLETATVLLTIKTKCDTFLFGQTLCWETFAAMDNPCPNTQPPHSEIKLSAECVGGTIVRLGLKNIGDAPTQGWHAYKIIRNDEILYDNGFNLAAQQSLSFDFPADGATWRMEATKFDDGTPTAVALENCGGLTPGYINAFWLDEGPVDYDFDCRQVIGSYDPNQKTAVPTGTGFPGLIAANHPLQYTIDFQNTGTDTAFRVLLRDVLPLDLDVNTFRPGFSSHPCTWQIRGQNTLEVLFSPIALPDSNVNEPASHGFFTFTIDQKPNLPDGTYFYNSASIIFDFNPPILTNSVWHYIGKLTVRVDEAQQHESLWRVWGNPVRDAATFRAEEFIAGKKQFELYDAAGQLVRSVQFSGQEFEFQRDLLPAGLYFFKISDAQGRRFTGKIVVAD